MNKKLRYTTIIHEAREELGLTYLEYCVVDSINKLSNNYDFAWCVMKNADLSSFIGLSLRHLARILPELKEKGLIEFNETGDVRTTKKWVEAVELQFVKGEQAPLALDLDKMSKNQDNMSIKQDSVSTETGQDVQRSINNIIYNKNKKQASLSSKTEVWLKNEEYIKSNVEKWKSKDYDFPTPDGIYDWRYLINRGKTTPDKFFGAIYWKTKEKLTNGLFSYSFKNKDVAWGSFSAEQKFASKLASMITHKQLISILEYLDEKAYDEKTKSYTYEYKLSTVLKNLDKINE